jgi:DNA-binding MarR family transcriptional regulator
VTKRLEDSGLIDRNSNGRDSRLAVFVISKNGRARLSEIEVIVSSFDVKLRAIVGATNEQDMVEWLQLILAAPFLAHED